MTSAMSLLRAARCARDGREYPERIVQHPRAHSAMLKHVRWLCEVDPESLEPVTTVFGIDVVVDESMPDGAWEIHDDQGLVLYAGRVE
jgi:hypothetical protein